MASGEGRIYIIQSGNTNKYKVGYSESPSVRRKSLQIGSADPLRVVGSIPGTRELEHSLHRDLTSRRIHGEWFRLTRTEINHILRLGIDD